MIVNTAYPFMKAGESGNFIINGAKINYDYETFAQTKSFTYNSSRKAWELTVTAKSSNNRAGLKLNHIDFSKFTKIRVKYYMSDGVQQLYVSFINQSGGERGSGVGPFSLTPVEHDFAFNTSVIALTDGNLLVYSPFNTETLYIQSIELI